MNGEVFFGAVLTDRGSSTPRAVDVGDAWRDAAANVDDAYRRWCAAPRADRSDGHAAYLAAVEREAAAATYLRVVLDDTASG